MERAKYIYIILVLFNATFVFSQNHPEIYKAFVKNDMGLWEATIETLEIQDSKAPKEQLDLVNYYYGYIAYCIDQGWSKQARTYLAKARVIINKLEMASYQESMLLAYRSAFVGFDIGLAPFKAPFIGPKSLAFAEKAKSLNAKNAFAYVQLGNIAFYTPEVFGGSKEEALRHYLKAYYLEKENNVSTDWNYLNLLASIVLAYKEVEDYKFAKRFCEEALEVAPDFLWVKDELYPEILNIIKER